MKGIVHSFESLAAVDGEGLRCAVFLAGCPLRCVYCHNPDTWNPCNGTETEAAALVRKISRYRPYFGKDGGVTFSGGEPLLQAEFLQSMIPLLREQNIRYIIDTSGAVKLTESVQNVLRGAQSVLLDIKFPNEEQYRRYTGHGMADTLATLTFLNKIGKKTRIRIVVVPGINDGEEAMDSYLARLNGFSCIDRIELLPFHTMGFFKYDELAIANPLADTPPLDGERKRQLQTFVNEKWERMQRAEAVVSESQ